MVGSMSFRFFWATLYVGTPMCIIELFSVGVWNAVGKEKAENVEFNAQPWHYEPSTFWKQYPGSHSTSQRALDEGKKIAGARRTVVEEETEGRLGWWMWAEDEYWGV